jgi:hypothetical protein
MNKKHDYCFECESFLEIQLHHVVPKSKGGTKTVPLCGWCHAKIHGVKAMMTSTLTKAAMARKQINGEYIGGHVPYGYSVEDGKLIKNPTEQAVIEMIIEARDAGQSYRAIAEKFNRYNVPRRDGTSWHTMAVKRALSK